MKSIETFAEKVLNEGDNTQTNQPTEEIKEEVTAEQPVEINEEQPQETTEQETKTATDDLDLLLDEVLKGRQKTNEILEKTEVRGVQTERKEPIATEEKKEIIEEHEKKVKDELDKIDDLNILKEKYEELQRKYAETVIENQGLKVNLNLLEQELEQARNERKQLWNEKKDLERELERYNKTNFDEDLKNLNDYYKLHKEGSDIYTFRNLLAEAGKIISKASGRDFSPYIIEFLKQTDVLGEEGTEDEKTKPTTSESKKSSVKNDFISLIN